MKKSVLAVLVLGASLAVTGCFDKQETAQEVEAAKDATANAATPALTTDPTNKFDFFMINPSYIIFMSLIYRFENLRLSTLYSNYC